MKSAAYLTSKVTCVVLAALSLLSCQNATDVKSEQYFVEGYQLYMTYCANCHQEDGRGMTTLYPSVTNAKTLKDKALLACIIKNGMKGPIEVDGRIFNRPMPANPRMTDIEIAEIVSFLTIKWGKDTVYTPTDFIQKTLAGCGNY